MVEVGTITFHTDGSYHVNDEYPVNDGKAPGGNPPYRLRECTGLTDKNGKEIYEGDVVRVYGFTKLPGRGRRNVRTPDDIRIVKWKQTKNWQGFGLGMNLDTIEYEVIGNIYENSELLVNS